MEKFIPSDNEQAKRKGEEWSLGQRGLHLGYWGVCGPSTIAVLTKKTIKEIIELWDGKYKGYAPMKEMETVLKDLGYKTERKKGMKARQFPEPTTDNAIVRVQWLKDDGTEYPWWIATQHTHYVIMQKINNKWWIFCNGTGWFEKDSIIGKFYYLKRGFISSYFEIKK